MSDVIDTPTADPAEHSQADAPAKTAQADGGDSKTATADRAVFETLTEQPGTPGRRDLDRISEIPVHLTVELGKTRLALRELLDLAEGSLVELEGAAGRPMDIRVNGHLIAHGEVVNLDDRFGLRITDIVNRAERIDTLDP